LEDRYKLPVPNDHKQGLKGDDSLVAKLEEAADRTVTNRRSGSGTGFKAMVTGKLQYIDDNDREDGIVMKHQGRGYGSTALDDGDVSVGTIFKVTSKDEGKNVTWQWMCDQIKMGEDVEVVYAWENAQGAIEGGHVVRAYGCGKTEGRPWIKYLHDRDQSDDTMGLETVTVFVDDLDNDGMPNFGSRTSEINFAWSESASDELKNGEFAPPQTLSQAVVNAASFLDQKLTGGAIGSVFGVFRTMPSSPLSEEDAVAQALPNILNGVQVWINGIAAPLFFAGDGQVNFLVPSEVEPGIASLLVMVNGEPSDLVSFPVLESAPGMFMLPEELAGPGRAVIQNQDFSINLPTNPASVGQVLILYLTGTGPTSPPIPTGEVAPSTPPLALLTLDTTVTIGGVAAPVHFAGGAPGFAGLTQINVGVPALPPGDYEVVVTVDGVASPGLLVAVGP
jgi:uncharacterized protein (TIGR03437 family)